MKHFALSPDIAKCQLCVPSASQEWEDKSRKCGDLGSASLDWGRNFILAVPGHGASGPYGGLVARR